MNAAPMPHAVSWNLTERCNLRCSHCYLDAKLRSAPGSEELPAASCLQIVDELASLNPRMVLILTGGEPLLHRGLGRIVERAARAGMTPVLGSNGTLIRPRLAAELRDLGVRGWGISIDSVGPDGHDRLRGVPGAWRRSLGGLRVLRELGVPFVVQASIFSWNRHELGELARLALELGAESVNFYFLVCTGRGQGVTDLPAEACEEALREIGDLQRELDGRIGVKVKCAPHHNRVLHQEDADSDFVSGYAGGCPAATHYFRIGPRGEVSACPYIPSQGASIRHQGLRDVWQRDGQLSTLRERGSLGGRCGRCEYRDLCGGCRARALAASGDLMAEDPSCLHEPRGGPRLALAPERTFGGQVRFGLAWNEEARRRLEAVPSFLAAMVVMRVEEAARQAGQQEVTAELMSEVRARSPMARRPEA